MNSLNSYVFCLSYCLRIVTFCQYHCPNISGTHPFIFNGYCSGQVLLNSGLDLALKRISSRTVLRTPCLWYFLLQQPKLTERECRTNLLTCFWIEIYSCMLYLLVACKSANGTNRLMSEVFWTGEKVMCVGVCATNVNNIDQGCKHGD